MFFNLINLELKLTTVLLSLRLDRRYVYIGIYCVLQYRGTDVPRIKRDDPNREITPSGKATEGCSLQAMRKLPPS